VIVARSPDTLAAKEGTMIEMFKPNLTLHAEAEGKYTLRAETLAPNGCYGPGRAVIGVPPTVRITAETLPVLLNITHRGGICAMHTTIVRHRLRHLDLAGKNNVLAFAMVDGKVVGSAAIAAAPPIVEVPPIDTHGWYAWVNRMPPGPASLHVIGTVSAPTPGYRATLALAEPQGINPKELILDLHLEALPGIWPDVVTPMSVRYDQPSIGVDYDGVLIRIAGSEAVRVPVEQVF
jgi:hypothetical protein